MPLSSEHIPLPCSLREAVLRRFPQSGGEAGHPTLPRDQLIRFLGKLGNDTTSPLVSLRRHAESEGASASLEPLHGSVVEWVTLSFEHWEDNYPLEPKLALELRKLLPLAIALAVSEDHFFTPGAHPLHQLLDCLQQSAVGWQQRLDRAGQMLEQRVMRAVVKAREWFDDRSVDFAHITRELTAAAERDAARAQRMVQRLAEAEAASLKTEQVKRDAARVINTGLEKYQLPAAIGEFLKGPWFDSAQLVALKFGTDSHEWRQVQRATQHLMESVQPRVEADDANRDRLANIVKRLPHELREWLLSLQHDPDAADDAIGLVEYAHLRLRHAQNLGLTHIPPIAVAGSRRTGDRQDEDAVELNNGQWFLLQDDEGELRAQLTLQLEDGQHLLFTNVVGLKALDLRRDQFLRHLKENRARPLPAEDSFSLSLANTAGIDSNDRLRALIDPSFAPEPPEDDSVDSDDTEPDVSDVFERADMDALAAGRSGQASAGSAAEEWKDPLPNLNRGAERPAADSAVTEIESLELTLVEDSDTGSPPAPVQPTAAPTTGPDLQQAESRRPEAVPQRPQENSASFSDPSRDDQAFAARSPDTRASGTVRQRTAEPDIDVPMGAWLGFHDGETPIMAKLAVYDPRRDNYIFVNRRGIALRELSRSELLGLIDEGLVDILETRSYFRDEVQRARGQHHD
ncbi:MAG: DUF1631 family protein [Chromatocurvus sp.]